MKIKYKVIVFAVLLAIITGLLVFGTVNTIQFNNKVIEESYSSLDLFPEEQEENCIHVELEDTTSQQKPTALWQTKINSPTENYESIYYELHISNSTEHKVNTYAVRVDFKTPAYLHTGWCGTFEIHQFRNGKELVQEIDLQNRPTNESDYMVEVSQPSDTIIFYFEEGDYFLYLPSASDGMVPLPVNDPPVSPGFILLDEIGHTPTLSVSQELRRIRIPVDPDRKDDNALTLSMKSRDDAWTKVVDPEGKGITQPDYFGQTYDLVFKNTTKNKIEKYSMTFTVESDVYIASAWNGSVEITQDGKTYLIKDLRSFTPEENTDIKYLSVGTDVLIPLASGDSFTYIPSEEYLEAPLSSSVSIQAGLILYQRIGSDLYGSASIQLNYHKSFLQEPVFLCAFIFFVIWMISFLFEVLFQIRLISYKKQKEHQEKIIIESIETFTGFIDAKDPYTSGHSHRVAYYTRLLADQLGYHNDELQRIYYIALLHDCGKIGIPDSILRKPAKLTDEEFKIIKSHPVLSAQVLNKFTSIEGIKEGVLYHHERYDG